ncbi:MAG: transcription elongation factor GreA [Tenericutes bacterium GWC2_34_14]|nr:MAG: transcription elongation factor GreA [Tenericutes bacterium GWA2_35_7]OHE28478.1 MAG: transcription elongation factor GreA [Tenericutes bacterium GWC2_34_14]OHE33614.1 MAG: transcription elongation factor GreA [Tenericutes bacterium GWE2_34_108]OHE36899.1 MAG: transcription elongation factor GreA [Tenericutes bacterium GWF1_35_14]OHE38021.1 MAG: transcription elongation factor GreA [Tenericutes bacterium GWF2_35_184]OHE43462.1 MAG: transcription elongation factor GreA [Tenericutes bact
MAVKQLFQLTQEGVDNLKTELTYLKDVKREENKEALKEARAQGDLSENADYDAARNEQARIESRIAEIETILKNVKIIKTDDRDIVNIGKSVIIRFVETGEEKEFTLVGSIEADPRAKKISTESPIGKALMNKMENEVVEVKTETGKIFSVEIVEIK